MLEPLTLYKLNAQQDTPFIFLESTVQRQTSGDLLMERRDTCLQQEQQLNPTKRVSGKIKKPQSRFSKHDSEDFIELHKPTRRQAVVKLGEVNKKANSRPNQFSLIADKKEENTEIISDRCVSRPYLTKDDEVCLRFSGT